MEILKITAFRVLYFSIYAISTFTETTVPDEKPRTILIYFAVQQINTIFKNNLSRPLLRIVFR